MRLASVVFILMFVCASASAQTFILIRHAEKESGTDPQLTIAGQQRAEKLVALFEKQNIDAIYSTNFNRTKNTVKPLADSKGIEIQIYERQPDLDKIIEMIGVKGTVVICGHSNTIPALANQLLGKEQFKNFDDNDYGNILIINGSSVTHLRY